jgi:hypothetical protein
MAVKVRQKIRLSVDYQSYTGYGSQLQMSTGTVLVRNAILQLWVSLHTRTNNSTADGTRMTAPYIWLIRPAVDCPNCNVTVAVPASESKVLRRLAFLCAFPGTCSA